MPISQILLMLGGVVVIWAVMRFVIARKTGSPGLITMFKRETALPTIGMGREAIKTLVDDAAGFVAIELNLRGLVLAGPFASKLGLPDSVISLVFITDDLTPYQDREWLGRWGYPARDHRVEDYHREDGENHVIHHLGLRGAPPVMAWFVEIPIHVATPPDALRPALIEGMSMISDPTGQISAILRNWRGTPES